MKTNSVAIAVRTTKGRVRRSLGTGDVGGGLEGGEEGVPLPAGFLSLEAMR